MRLLISFAALLLSVVLLQLSSGAIAPLDALSGFKVGFSKSEIGLLGSAHFLGFFIGCWWCPRMIGNIGHSRAFAAFAACGAIAAIAHPMLIDPIAWALMRVMTGLCVAGCFTVIEAWLQAKLTNEIRGRVMGSYRVVDIGTSAVAQLMIGVLEPASYVSYNLLAILCCACIFPLTLTRSIAPEVPKTPSLRPIRAAMTSPLGVAGVMVAGVSSSSLRMVGPIYGQEIGLTQKDIGYFLATVLIGGALAQFPVGYFADKYDRRWVLIWISVLSIAVCAALSLFGSTTQTTIFALAFAFGFTTFPIYSVSTSHANDFATPEDRMELSASLLFCYAIGAILSPVVAAWIIENFGSSALFTFIAMAHVFLVVFGIYRMWARPTSEIRVRYSYMPRTSYYISRLVKRRTLDED